MDYSFNKVTVRTDNSPKGMAKTDALWADIMSGKIPLDYENDDNGKFDLTIMCVTAEFFGELERRVLNGEYVKIDESGADIKECADKAWRKVWEMTARGELLRAYTRDYESVVPPPYTKDGKAHCYLYIAVTAKR
ncbi:MAG: AraC family transcriptional regulator [Clostridia bacterium]|nr:AraC family transcriptional regulator [Clostridia bacterium]